MRTVYVKNSKAECNGNGNGNVASNNQACNNVIVNNDIGADGPINEGARTSRQAASPHAATPCAAVVCSRRPPLRCTGKWCSSVAGVGTDNPKFPQSLTANERSKAVSFFFRSFSKFDVSDALAARTTARRVSRAQRQVHTGRRAR